MARSTGSCRLRAMGVPVARCDANGLMKLCCEWMLKSLCEVTWPRVHDQVRLCATLTSGLKCV